MTLDLGVLVSGSGTNLQAILDATESRRLDARVRIVISNKPMFLPWRGLNAPASPRVAFLTGSTRRGRPLTKSSCASSPTRERAGWCWPDSCAC